MVTKNHAVNTKIHFTRMIRMNFTHNTLKKKSISILTKQTEYFNL